MKEPSTVAAAEGNSCVDWPKLHSSFFRHPPWKSEQTTAWLVQRYVRCHKTVSWIPSEQPHFCGIGETIDTIYNHPFSLCALFLFYIQLGTIQGITTWPGSKARCRIWQEHPPFRRVLIIMKLVSNRAHGQCLIVTDHASCLERSRDNATWLWI